MDDTNKSLPKKKPRKIKGKVIIDIQKCKGCELCIKECKEDTLILSKEINNLGYRYAIVANDTCTGCMNCALICPDAVIMVYRTSPKKKESTITKTDVKSSTTEKIEYPST